MPYRVVLHGIMVPSDTGLRSWFWFWAFMTSVNVFQTINGVFSLPFQRFLSTWNVILFFPCLVFVITFVFVPFIGLWFCPSWCSSFIQFPATNPCFNRITILLRIYYFITMLVFRTVSAITIACSLTFFARYCPRPLYYPKRQSRSCHVCIHWGLRRYKYSSCRTC